MAVSSDVECFDWKGFKECGDDGCGGSCGDCPPAAPYCADYVCWVVPPPCEENEHVVDHTCVPCPDGLLNPAGDDASGPDTSCYDPCLAELGVTCEDFNQAYIKASNTDHGHEFGYSVTLDGDTLVVGARYEDSCATGIDGDQSCNSNNKIGAVYVFVRTGTTWAQQAYIKAPLQDSNPYFGSDVALDGDTLVVGAPRYDNKGAAFVFVGTGTTWAQQAYMTAPNAGGHDWFGASVALDGDTLAVGACDEDSNATGIDGDEDNNESINSGAVYVFERSGSTWTQQAYVKASNTASGDLFGYSVALDGDTMAVGAQSEDSNATGIEAFPGRSQPHQVAVATQLHARLEWAKQWS